MEKYIQRRIMVAEMNWKRSGQVFKFLCSSQADTHLLSDKGDTCSTSATLSYRQRELEEKDEKIN